MTPTIVGIDLGTTFSLAAYVQDGRPVVVRDDKGAALVPSVISFHDDGSVPIGPAARLWRPCFQEDQGSPIRLILHMWHFRNMPPCARDQRA